MSGAGDVPRAALTGAVPALVDRDDLVPGTQVPCQGVPFTRVPGQAVQQHEGLPRPAPVPADEPDTVSHDDVLGPCHAVPPMGCAGLDHALAARGPGRVGLHAGRTAPRTGTGAESGG
ncbi:hypothetical protein GCM10022233_68940 [Streptomyces shaanxiensis]|uniref:Uncharacterized protein n=1 Tax=Streptomyces shaanxiensis TaxID=653357 RepID=A0ABP7W235_9ACTN